jgi:P27 family predicted phage terminase small subunit
MGARGPAKRPTALSLLHGETRPSRIGRNPVRVGDAFPRMPADLSDEAKTVWRRVRSTQPRGVIGPPHADLLAAYCETVARWRQAQRLLAQTSLLIRAEGHGARAGELVKNPLIQVVRDATEQVRLLARELGLSPASLVAFEHHAPPPQPGSLLSLLEPRLHDQDDPG